VSRRPADHRSVRAGLKALCALLLAVLCATTVPGEPLRAAGATIAAADLPPEARGVLARIRDGGPFAYKRDGITFGNFERRLPVRPRGYYHEYTVPTPGARDRGARRIITGANGELYFTDDHYSTFKRILE
jgi:ribonuclease T1